MQTSTFMLKRFATLFFCNALLCVPLAAQAYIGPGAGLSLLGALWALVVALGAALVFVCAWPIRRLLRRLRADKAVHDAVVVEGEIAPSGDDGAATRDLDNAEPRQ